MTNLYPNLNEPWSDVDEEGTGERDEDTLGSRLYTYTESPSEAAPFYHASPASSPRHYDTDAVSLADFQDHYLKRPNNSGTGGRHHGGTPGHYSLLHRYSDSPNLFESSRSPNNLSQTRNDGSSSLSSLVASCGSRARELVAGGVRWSAGASLWQKALLTVLLGLLCSMVISTLRQQWSNSAMDNFLPCPSSTEAVLLPLTEAGFPPCISRSEMRVAKVAAFNMREILNDRAARYICGHTDVPSLSLSLRDLQQQHGLKDVSRSDIKNVFYLILVNPHWNIRWMDRDNKTVSDWTHSPHPTDLLTAISPSLPLKCTLLLWLASAWKFIQWIVLALMSVVGVCALVILYQRRRRSQKSATFALVSRIIDVMKYHYKKSCSKKDLLPYLAIIHVRDMLIPPSERKAKEQLWSAAVSWIASHESRLRVETRRIAGEDFEVWKWIQEDPPPTEIPSRQPPGSSGRNQGNWYGNVFDHYPPEITTKVAPPTGTPSPCIRLKNMFEPIRKMGEGQCRELESSVLERCHPHGAVVHVWVDKKSPVGCVYLKMGSLKCAMGAYNALHGGWYKGKLVTAKYIPEAKYHKWFPAALTAKTPLERS